MLKYLYESPLPQSIHCTQRASNLRLQKLFGEEASKMEQAFEIAELAHLTENERSAYENSLKIYRDNINVLETTREVAWAGGKVEEKETAKRMLAKGFEISLISELTGLSEDEIQKLME